VGLRKTFLEWVKREKTKEKHFLPNRRPREERRRTRYSARSKGGMHVLRVPAEKRSLPRGAPKKKKKPDWGGGGDCMPIQGTLKFSKVISPRGKLN